jgi:hypothetical protein
MRFIALASSLLLSLLTLGCASVAPAPPPKIEAPGAHISRTGPGSEVATTLATVTLWPLEVLPTVAISAIPDCSNSVVNAASCKIRVKVTNEADESCKIELGQPSDDLISIGEVPPGTIIYWQIVDVTGHDSFIFTRSDGINFLDNFGKKRAFFNGQRVDDDAQIFQWEKRNRGRRVLAYVINVRSKTGSRDCSLDPWIRNIA